MHTHLNSHMLYIHTATGGNKKKYWAVKLARTRCKQGGLRRQIHLVLPNSWPRRRSGAQRKPRLQLFHLLPALGPDNPLLHPPPQIIARTCRQARWGGGSNKTQRSWEIKGSSKQLKVLQKKSRRPAQARSVATRGLRPWAQHCAQLTTCKMVLSERPCGGVTGFRWSTTALYKGDANSLSSAGSASGEMTGYNLQRLKLN